MSEVDSFDVIVSVYQIDVGEKNVIGLSINAIDLLKCAAFKTFKLVNPDDKMYVLAYR